VALLRVLLVDDHLMLTEALAARLSAIEDLWVLGRYATDDPRLASVVRRSRPDVISIDVEPLGAGLAAMLHRLRDAWTAVRVVALTGSRDHMHAVEAAREGVEAWIAKDATLDQLVEALRGVCHGRAFYPPEHLGPVLRHLRADVRAARDRSGPLDVLSRRENDVLLLMVEGKAAHQIASELLISTNTVRTHVRNILTKLSLHSSLEAVSVARAAGVRPREDPAQNRGATLRVLTTT